MKDSGVEWLGKVPATWQVMRLKHVLSRNDGGVWGSDPSGKEDTIVLRSTEQTVDGYWLISNPAYRSLSVSEKAAATLEEGDLLVTKSSGSSLHIGKTTLVDAEVSSMKCCYSNFMQRLRTNDRFAPKLAWYVLNNDIARQQLDLSSNSTTGLANLNSTMLGDIWITVPSVEEQNALVDRLDRATSRIDALVAKKTRFIELLHEKRQALITQAVTKGLDPNVPMKDSGVEWLGDVPADWDTAPLRVFLQQRRDIVGSESRSTKLLSLTLQGVIERDLENPTGKMPASFDTYQRVADGEMVFCLFDMDETPRTVGIAPQDGMITGAYTVFRPTADVWARYLYYFFLHVDDHKRLKPFYKGMRKTIRPGPFLSIQVPRPSELAARDIADYLDRATARVDTLIAKTERSIELLREHRTALITAAVTGKIDLREAA